MQTGSWMWHKMLKLRSVAKLFYKVEVGNGRHTSFWYDNWSRQGVLIDLLGDRGFIDMGVRKNATVEDAVLYGRRRSNPSLEGIDRSLWRRDSGYKLEFSTQETWHFLRDKKPLCSWAPGIWFSQATPKFAFMAWLSVRERMSTMDRVVKWSRGSNDMCVLCHNAQESRNHLFFECDLFAQVWEFIAKGLLRQSFTVVWSEIITIISDKTREKKSLLCIRYVFQAVLYALWREKLKHGEKMMPLPALKKVIEKGIRNTITLVQKKGGRGMEMLMQFWFQTRM
ncbi:uncharacterized protein LOC106408189 [Brassica napus]|uniref:uncharacterized protein LOC106408189 n=1 Tax=Brassica napus TaxID=3708 RepID=UPI002078DB0F|nr:uncharacterized protein LOC106408189 [Brassica napus]